MKCAHKKLETLKLGTKEELLAMVGRIDGVSKAEIEAVVDQIMADGPEAGKLFDKMRAIAGGPDGLEINGFGIADAIAPVSDAVSRQNKYLSGLLVMAGTKSIEGATPLLKEYSDKLGAKFNLYKQMLHYIETGFGNSETYQAMKVVLKVSGDYSEKKLMEVMFATTDVQKRNFELRQKTMVALDKRISKAFKGDKRKIEIVNEVFGIAGFGNLSGSQVVVDELMRMIETGKLDGFDSLIKLHESSIAKKDLDRAREVAEDVSSYMVDRKVGDGHNRNTIETERQVLATLYALRKLDENGKGDVVKLLNEFASKKELYVDLSQLAVTLKAGSEELMVADGQDSRDYDGNYIAHIFQEEHHVEVVSQKMVNSAEFTQKHSLWTIVRAPTSSRPGIAYRMKTSSTTEGLGTKTDRNKVGVTIDMSKMPSKIQRAIRDGSTSYLADNNIIKADGEYRVVMSRAEESIMKPKNNFAHTFYRTLAHTQDVLETQGARILMMEQLTETVKNADDMARLNRKIKRNEEVGMDQRRELPVFLNYGLELDAKTEAYVAKRYKKVTGLTTFAGFDKKVQYIRKDMKDIYMGSTHSGIAGVHWPVVQRVEQYYLQLVQMAKIHMVVAAPVKLAKDIVSNTVLLTSMDVGLDEIGRYSKAAFVDNKGMTKLQNDLIRLKLQYTIAKSNDKDVVGIKKRLDAKIAEIKNDPFYDAMRFGFHTSMGTEMMIKEFDTVTGLQNNIDAVLTKVLKDANGEGTVVDKALVKWMNAGPGKRGFGLDDALRAAGEASKMNGTTIGKELVEIADRLADTKETKDTVRYIGELIAAPSSELVRQGSRVMTMGDMVAKSVLYNSTIDRLAREAGVTADPSKGSRASYLKAVDKALGSRKLDAIKVEAATLANATFFDYRQNMPETVDSMSRYGVLMFPSFWMRAQRVIYNLAKYHPANTAAGLLIAQYTGDTGLTIMSANLLNKLSEDTIVNPGYDVLQANTLLPRPVVDIVSGVFGG